MKISLQKLIILFSLLLSSNLYSQCDLPLPWEGNTGANMTTMFPPSVVDEFPSNLVEDAYVVAVVDASGLTVGSEPVYGVDQFAVAVWGDDTQNPGTNGALAGDEISYYIVNGDELFDIDFTFWIIGDGSSYVTNGINSAVEVTISLNCSNSESNSQCDLPELYSGNTGVNMTLIFSADLVSSLPISSDSAYLVAISPEGLVVGSMSLAQGDLIGGQQSMAVWGDDTLTPEVDGLSEGQEMTLQLVDGDELYDIDITSWLTGSNSYISYNLSIAGAASAELKTCSDSDVSTPGCTDPIAFNYNADANTDDGSCIPVFYGCTDNGLEINGTGIINDQDGDGLPAFNYNPQANTDDGSCIPVIIGCTLDWADNYNADANTDDGSCYREGCTYDWADNFDEYATIDDGSCYRLGCISDWADNYDSLATISDSSCFIQLNEEEYQSLSEGSQGSSGCEEIVIDIQEGWNIFGYTSSQVIEIGEVMAPYDDKIYIIKDNNGSQYWPANNYNGIGDFIPGGGYQIKAYESFSISF